MSKKYPHLVILPTIKAMLDRRESGRVVLTGKFLTGMALYAKKWPGDVALLIQGSQLPDSNLDHESVAIDDLPYHLKVVNYNDPKLLGDLAKADVVLASVSWQQNHISSLCQQVNVPCVYVSEYAFETRMQIEKSRVNNKLVLLRRWLWNRKHEALHRKALSLAAGLQANGTPTYNDYLGLAGDSLLYFDSRVHRQDMATQDDIDIRYADLHKGRPMRLAFSGRLLPMKGTDDLPRIAKALKDLNVPFYMDIYGGGELETTMFEQIRKLGLTDCVNMCGVEDFARELLPTIKREIDVFVCPHRQGDPSCTYLETMSCGVPIVGYGNAAFCGVTEHAGAGWVTPMNKPEILAKQIAKLHENRRTIVEHATRSLQFAMNHSFDDTFSRRVDHLLMLAKPYEQNGDHERTQVKRSMRQEGSVATK